ncbi:MAG: precorrin-2 C(20)-methyltransferase [Rikenellaceae bacterium]
MNPIITFVSLGPGDPELITLKGHRTLMEADVILCPSTLNREGVEHSKAEEVIGQLDVDCAKVERFVVPMSRDREKTFLVYSNTAQRAVELAKGGKRVAITAEGDAGFYSSSQYIEEAVWAMGGQTSRIAGVPAFIDCARRANVHVVSQDSSFEVIARVDSAEQLLGEMAQDKSIVLMKISQWEEAIKSAISQSEEHDFYYVESCGVEGREFFSSVREEIVARKFPYFAILIIKRKK